MFHVLPGSTDGAWYTCSGRTRSPGAMHQDPTMRLIVIPSSTVADSYTASRCRLVPFWQTTALFDARTT
jgi:hypothetical protein